CVTDYQIKFVIFDLQAFRPASVEGDAQFGSGSFRPRQLQAFFALINAEDLDFFSGSFLKGNCMTARAGIHIKNAPLVRQRDMCVDEFGKALAPVGGDKQVAQIREFFFSLVVNHVSSSRYFLPRKLSGRQSISFSAWGSL